MVPTGKHWPFAAACRSVVPDLFFPGSGRPGPGDLCTVPGQARMPDVRATNMRTACRVGGRSKQERYLIWEPDDR